MAFIPWREHDVVWFAYLCQVGRILWDGQTEWNSECSNFLCDFSYETKQDTLELWHNIIDDWDDTKVFDMCYLNAIL